MKRNIVLGTVLLLAGSVLAADSDVKGDVKNAAKKLAAANGYSWKTTVESPQGGRGARFRPGPTEGQAGRDGAIHLSMTRGENTIEAYLKGDKGALKTDEGWKSLSEAAESDGGGQPNPTMFMARMLRNYKAPAAEAEDLAGKAKELKSEDGAYAGDLTEEAVKQLVARGPRRPGAEPPEVADAKGSVKFWLKDGVLSKYEYQVQGKMSFNGNDLEINRTTTVAIKEIGSTKVQVPDDAKKKLS